MGRPFADVGRIDFSYIHMDLNAVVNANYPEYFNCPST